jgi:hypothetical protein
VYRSTTLMSRAIVAVSAWPIQTPRGMADETLAPLDR